MKKGWIAVIVVVAVLVLIGGFLISNYNGLVTAQEELNSRLSNIDTQLQRRSDLIPNLVSTVQGYTDHENEILTQISDARARLAGATDTAEKSAADNELSGALSRLLMVVENYPDLKADTQFTALSDELAGTENRITVARQDYNDAARAYNTMIKRFPKTLFASMFGFSEAAYFEAQEGAETAPQVSFD